MGKETIKRKAVRKKPDIPEQFIRDEFGGNIYPYKGWKDALEKSIIIEGKKTCSTYQAIILAYLNDFYHEVIRNKNYWFFLGESGLHLRNKVNMGLDIAIYDKKVLPVKKISTKYADVPPKVIVEIDIKIDLGNKTEMEYITEKTQELLRFGVEKVIWVLSSTKQVVVAVANENWQIIDWHKDIEWVDGHCFNIGKYLGAEGIEL